MADPSDVDAPPIGPDGSGSPTPADGVFDVVVVGAGAAGVGAGRRLAAETGLSFLLLEAGPRVGGRAHTLTGRSGAALDLGCGWLHSADRNAWVAIAEANGLTVDRSRPPWERRMAGVNLSSTEAAQFGAALQAFEARLEAAAGEDDDRPASDLFTAEDSRWRPMLDAFSCAYNGAPFRCISVKDYAAYQPSDENWRVREGYGVLVQRAAQGLPIRLNTPVRRIDRRGRPLRLLTETGPLMTRAVVVTASTPVLAGGALAFDPPLDAVAQAASALPLGHVNKAFLALGDPEAFPVDHMVSGRTDTVDTGSYTLRPLGLPIVEAFIGGEAAAALEEDGPGALLAFATDELAALFGSDLRRRLRPLAESRWTHEPWIGGAYSHAQPGCAGARAELRRPVEERIFLAGEACSAHAFSTAHGAYETGIAAAQAAVDALAGAAASAETAS